MSSAFRWATHSKEPWEISFPQKLRTGLSLTTLQTQSPLYSKLGNLGEKSLHPAGSPINDGLQNRACKRELATGGVGFQGGR